MTKLTEDENNTKRPKYYEMTLIRNDWKTFCKLIYVFRVKTEAVKGHANYVK